MEARPRWRKLLLRPPSAIARGYVRISCVQVKKAAFRPSSFWIRTSQTWVRRPTCSGRPMAVSTSPTRPAAKTLALSSAVVKSCPGCEVTEGAPGGHRVRERHPDAAVHVAAGVEVAAVDLEASLDLVVLDPHDLDAEVAREAVLRCPCGRARA